MQGEHVEEIMIKPRKDVSFKFGTHYFKIHYRCKCGVETLPFHYNERTHTSVFKCHPCDIKYAVKLTDISPIEDVEVHDCRC